MKKNMFIYEGKMALLCIAVSLFTSCSNDLFDKQPLDQASDGTFWKTASDAKLALTG